MVETQIQGKRVLLGDGSLGPAALSVGDGQILGVSRKAAAALHDAGDLLVLLGIVDIHGDAFERQIFPRPRAGVSADIGLMEADRQMIANGITTAFHGLTVNWEPGSRDIVTARAILDSLSRLKPRLVCDTKVHLRHEALSLDTVDESIGWMRDGLVTFVAINDHREHLRRDLERGINRSTSSVSMEELAVLASKMFAREAEVPASLERIAQAAREAELPLASHDDDTPEARAASRALGCTLCEFPGDTATAEAARAAGDDIILGSPNIVRGGSHLGRVGAADMIRHGLCTVLCSDYYYPSILLAPFLLAAKGILPFAAAWELVSRAPAHAAKLEDRGTLEPGKRADLLFIDDRDPQHPEVAAAFVRGIPVFLRGRHIADALTERARLQPLQEVLQ